jgi:hypothetical protein
MTPAERIAALQVEFDRLKERQDWLDKTMQGDADAWIHIIERLPDHVAEVTVDKVVSELRQGALAMATIVKTLASLGETTPAVPAADPADRLAQRRAEKLARVAGS